MRFEQLAFEQLAFSPPLLEQPLGRPATARPFVEPVVLVDTAGDDFAFIQEQWATAARTAQPTPIDELNGLRLAGTAQQDGSQTRCASQRLITFDRAAHATAHIALEIRDEDRVADRRFES